MSRLPVPDPVDRPWIERTAVLALPPSETGPSTRAGGDPARWDALARLAALRGPTLAPLVRVVPVHDAPALALTHLVPAGCAPVDELRSRAPLRAGQVAAVAVAVLEALDLLHEAGLAHGGITADRVLVAPDGGVVLAGTGLRWAVPPGSPGGPSPASDLEAVGELVGHLLGRGPGTSGLVLVALRATDPDPALRPTAAALRDLVLAAARPESLADLLWQPAGPTVAPVPPPLDVTPVDGSGSVHPDDGLAAPLRIDPRSPLLLPDDDRAAPLPVPVARTAPSPRPARDGARRARGRRRRGTGRTGVLGLLVAGVLVGGAVVGRTARAGEPPAAQTAPGATASVGPVGGTAAAPAVPHPPLPTPSGAGGASAASATDDGALDTDRVDPATDWAEVVAGLDRVRTEALSTGSLQQLALAVDPRGPAWPADAALARRVASSHARLDGGALLVSRVVAVQVRDAEAVLRVLDRRAAYTVTVDGRTEVRPERGPRWWRVRLVRVADGWRVEQVDAAVDDADVSTRPAP